MSSSDEVAAFLDDLHEFLEVLVFKVFVLLLVVGRLVQIRLNDVLHSLQALFAASDSLLIVLTEAELLLILPDLREALELEFPALEIELELGHFLNKLFEPKINFGCSAEVD